MARVLKEAEENPNIWKMEVTCDGNGWNQEGLVPCRRLIEIDERDIQKRSYNSYDEIETYYGFTCPECHCFTQIDEKLIPKNVKSKAIKYVKPVTA